MHVTPAAFARTVQAERRTLLIDEGDAFLAENEKMRNYLDRASDPETAGVSLCVKSGDDWTTSDQDLCVPIVIASIGRLRGMQTVEDRAIAIHLERATPAQRKLLMKAQRRNLDRWLNPLAAKCARFAQDNGQNLKNVDPTLPDELSGREQDKWAPLIAIADTCGGDFGLKARQAALDHHAAFEARDASPGETLLAEAKELLENPPVDKLGSFEICSRLNASPTSPWREYGGPRRPITEVQVANLLRDFRIRPKTIRLPGGRTAKGYVKRDFEDAWERYLK